jgi:hypothetical protein
VVWTRKSACLILFGDRRRSRSWARSSADVAGGQARFRLWTRGG